MTTAAQPFDWRGFWRDVWAGLTGVYADRHILTPRETAGFCEDCAKDVQKGEDDGLRDETAVDAPSRMTP